MFRGIDAALSGLRTVVRRSQSTANNIANVNTPSYKAERVITQSTGRGVDVRAVRADQTQGAILTTSNRLDAAITGAGYFKVVNAKGDTGFTRSGSFRVDNNNRLVDQNGATPQPPVTLPAGAKDVALEKDGSVSATVNGQRQTVGKVDVYTFNSPTGLERGGGNVYHETAASGQPIQGTAGAGGAGEIVPGAIEASNVDMASEMVNLITDRIAYTAQTKTIRAQDDMLGAILDIKS